MSQPTHAEIVNALRPALTYARQERQPVPVYLHCTAERWQVHVGDTAFVPKGELPDGWTCAVVTPGDHLKDVADELIGGAR